MVGAHLSDRYTLGDRIAAGGMGSVYLATDMRLDRKVAVKVLRPEMAGDERFTERFRREARAVAALSHPNIAAVFDYGEDDGRQYLVMELVDGHDLSRILREEGPLPPDKAARIAAEIADALGHAHAAGIVHRDVKPANVILTRDGRVKVTDFGIARAVGDSTLTATGSMIGTAQYLSPEQASGGNVGPLSDIYSLGVVIFEMLTGSVPFTGESLVAVAMRHMSEEVPAPGTLKAGIPPELDEVVGRATAKDPAARFSGAAEMATALRETSVTTTEGRAVNDTQQQTTIWPIPGSRWDPQRVGRWVIGILLGLAFIAAGLLIFRLATAEPAGGKKDTGEQPAGATTNESTPEETAPEEAVGFVIPGEWIGSNYHEVEKDLEDADFHVIKVFIDDTDYEKDAIVDTDPDPNETIPTGGTITLRISTGEFTDEGHEGDPPGKAHGHDKKDD